MKSVNFSRLLRCVNKCESVHDLWKLNGEGLVANNPPDFYEKFNQIKEAVIDYRISNEQINALKNFKNLNSLIVQDETSWDFSSSSSYDSSISLGAKWENTFEKLAEILPAIWSLELNDLGDAGSVLEDLELRDLEMVFKFKKLRRLLTRCPYSSDFVKSRTELYLIQF